MGLAEAVAIRERLLAEAAGKMADADAIQKRMLAEAEGLAKKGDAMKAMDGVGINHEEYRLRLDMQKEVMLEKLEANVAIAAKQAEIMAKAFEQANINIVGGDGAFFDKFINAVAVGKSIDGVMDNSHSLQAVLKDHLSGDKNLIDDLGNMVSGLSSSDMRDLTLSAVLGKMLTGADDEKKGKIHALIAQAKELGIDKLSS
jgi:hypothetical protein